MAAIGLLKFYDDQAQLAYNNFFNLPTAPPAPVVKFTPLEKEIVLDWGEDTTTVYTTERSSAKGYTFEGYNIYQLPSASATISRLAARDLPEPETPRIIPFPLRSSWRFTTMRFLEMEFTP